MDEMNTIGSVEPTAEVDGRAAQTIQVPSGTENGRNAGTLVPRRDTENEMPAIRLDEDSFDKERLALISRLHTFLKEHHLIGSSARTTAGVSLEGGIKLDVSCNNGDAIFEFVKPIIESDVHVGRRIIDITVEINTAKCLVYERDDQFFDGENRLPDSGDKANNGELPDWVDVLGKFEKNL